MAWPPSRRPGVHPDDTPENARAVMVMANRLGVPLQAQTLRNLCALSNRPVRQASAPSWVGCAWASIEKRVGRVLRVEGLIKYNMSSTRDER